MSLSGMGGNQSNTKLSKALSVQQQQDPKLRDPKAKSKSPVGVNKGSNATSLAATSPNGTAAKKAKKKKKRTIVTSEGATKNNGV